MLKLELYVYFSQKMSAYSRDFDETKYMSFLTKDDELSEKFNGIWEKSARASKKNLIVNLCTIKNIKKLNLNLKGKNQHKFS